MGLSGTRESQFERFVEGELTPFWSEYAAPNTFKNATGLDIHYVSIKSPDAIASIVISPGRVEGYLKYQELAYDFFQQGFDVYIIDHQGQGLSSRILKNQHKGYVGSFNDYVDDLYDFVSRVVLPNTAKKAHLVCHSMGGAIGLRFIQKHPQIFSSATFSSPMWGFLSGRVPQRLARRVVTLGKFTSGLFGRDSAYFFGGKNYTRKPFENNELSTSKVRYEFFRELYDRHPEIQLGGITFSWLQAAIEALDQAQADIQFIDTPMLVLQAAEDKVVDNLAQDRFCQQIHLSKPTICAAAPTVIEGSEHEIFIEADSKRDKALSLIFSFIKKYNAD